MLMSLASRHVLVMWLGRQRWETCMPTYADLYLAIAGIMTCQTFLAVVHADLCLHATVRPAEQVGCAGVCREVFDDNGSSSVLCTSAGSPGQKTHGWHAERM